MPDFYSLLREKWIVVCSHHQTAKFDGAHSLIDQVMLNVAPMREFVGFYRMGFPLPFLKSYCQIQDCNP